MIQLTSSTKISPQEATTQVLFFRGEVFTYFDEGTSRYVYVNSDQTKVLKIEKDRVLTRFNQEEYEIYQNAQDTSQMTHTDLIDGFIVQEFCLPIKFAGIKLTIPQQKFARSCRNEVGWKNGKLVCFDLDEFKKY